MAILLINFLESQEIKNIYNKNINSNSDKFVKYSVNFIKFKFFCEAVEHVDK